MTTGWILALIPMLLLLVVSIIVRSHCKSWIHPGAYFPLVVMLYFLLPLILAPDFYFPPGAMWWILASMMAFLSGSMILTYKHDSKSIKNNCTGLLSIDIDSDQVKDKVFGIHRFPSMKLVLIFSIALGLLYSILIVTLFGRSIGSFLSLEGLSDLGSELSVQRYSGGFLPSATVQVLLTFVYASPILGGMLMAVRENRKQLALSLLSFLPSLITFLAQTTRAAVLFAFILFLSGYFASQVFLGRSSNYRLFSRKRIPVYLAIILILLFAFAFGDINRVGKVPTISELNSALRSPRTDSYLFGHASAFSQWFQRAWSESENPRFGAATFGGVLTILGVRERVNTKAEAIYISSEGKTNIYSIFRRYAEDFSFAGSLLFLFIVGLIASIVYIKVGEGSLMLMPLLIAVYAFMGMQLTPIFRYSSIVAAFLVVQAYFIAIRLLQKKQPQNIS